VTLYEMCQGNYIKRNIVFAIYDVTGDQGRPPLSFAHTEFIKGALG
jgi:hypothetical protein